MRVKDRISELQDRGEPIVNIKIIREDDNLGAHLVNRKIKEKYKYYRCDYCGEEIKISDKWDEKTGSKIVIPSSITKCGEVTVALHNRCLKPMLKELEEE